MGRQKDLKGSREFLKLVRDNIEKNTERANRQWAKEHRVAEAPEEVKRMHRKMFEDAEYERDRRGD